VVQDFFMVWLRNYDREIDINERIVCAIEQYFITTAETHISIYISAEHTKAQKAACSCAKSAVSLGAHCAYCVRFTHCAKLFHLLAHNVRCILFIYNIYALLKTFRAPLSFQHTRFILLYIYWRHKESYFCGHLFDWNWISVCALNSCECMCRVWEMDGWLGGWTCCWLITAPPHIMHCIVGVCVFQGRSVLQLYFISFYGFLRQRSFLAQLGNWGDIHIFLPLRARKWLIWFTT
jgi:hypothetical protein